jgi:hypothetical protein
VTITGTLFDDTLIEPLAHGLASVSGDGFIIVDLSALHFSRTHLVPLTFLHLADSIGAGGFSVVMSRQSDRDLLRSRMTATPVHARLADALDHALERVV